MHRLCFGGSFNPIHTGHLICAQAVAEAARYERVVLIPSAQPPHKSADADLACPADRLAMCQLAAAQEPRLFEVSDIEIQRTGKSYTIDTVRQLKAHGWPEVHWLIGADMLAILPKWHQAEALIGEARLLIMARPGWRFDWAKLPAAFQHLQANVVSAPLIEISATDIRRRCAQGRSVRLLTPAPVADYIEQHHLYAE